MNSLISKWMPDHSKVAVDSHPRLSGILDTVNSTLGHGPGTRLPASFYDPKAQDIVDKIVVEEWFAGFEESLEYRQVGCGALAGDIVTRMVESVQESSPSAGKINNETRKSRIQFGLSGCHDTTIASLLASLGAFKGEKWPEYTSNLAFELFKASEPQDAANEDKSTQPAPSQGGVLSFFGLKKTTSTDAARKRTEDLSQDQKDALSGHYVRIRYNDRPMAIPGCKPPGKHLEGDESFCTLVSNLLINISRCFRC